MTVPTSDNREQYLGNDSATSFDYAFKIFQADDLVVILTASDDTETTLVRGSDYSVDGVGEEAGGTVIYPLSGDPLASGETLTILREIPVVQETDLRNQGRYYPETLEDEFDRSRMIDQQQEEQLGRALKKPRGGEHYDAGGARIQNLGDAEDDSDALTNKQMRDYYTTIRESVERANDFIEGAEYIYLGDYAADITIEHYNQLLRDSAGEFWRVSGSTELPYTTTGTGLPEGGVFVTVGDAAIRAQLADSTDSLGSDLVAHSGTSNTVTQTLNTNTADINRRISYVDTITDLKELTISNLLANQTVQISTTGRSGTFVWMTGDQSANITDDPQQGVWVAPNDDATGASGAWMRDHDLPGVHVDWFGAKAQDANVDSAPAIQAGNDYLEQVGRVGGFLVFGRGAYRCGSTLRVGGQVSWTGAGAFTTSLYWDSGVLGNLITLGPDQSGEFGYSGQYAFGCVIENMDLNFGDVYRGADKALIYTEGAHQNSGLRNVYLRGIVSYALNYADAIGGVSSYFLEDVNIQGSTTDPTLGGKGGIRCDAKGAIFTLSRVQVECGDTAPFEAGLNMLSGHLSAKNVHFEGCDIGVGLYQNEGTIRTNTLSDITGNHTVPLLITVGATTNVSYQIHSASNTSIDPQFDLIVLQDNATGFIKRGPGGASISDYNNAPREGSPTDPIALANYLVGSGLSSNYGIASVAKISAGVFEFTTEFTMPGINPVLLPSVRFSSAANGTAVATPQTTTKFEVRCYNATGTLADPQRIFVAAYYP